MSQLAAHQMHAYYAQRAPYYDAVYEQPERQEDIAFLRQHLADCLSGRNVLEIACGTGYWSQHIAPRCPHYTATDALEEPLSLARQRPGLAHAQCLVADAYALPESLGRFSGAFAGLWFSHVAIERRHEFFQSLHARLEPGARVLLLDNSERQCVDHPLVETDAHGNTYQQRPLRDGSRHRVLKNFPSDAELMALATAFSLRETRIQRLANFWLFDYQLPR